MWGRGVIGKRRVRGRIKVHQRKAKEMKRSQWMEDVSGTSPGKSFCFFGKCLWNVAPFTLS